MEANVLAAVRVQRLTEDHESVVEIVQYDQNNSPGYLAAVQAESKTFPVSFAFGPDHHQEAVYVQMLAPFMPSFLEGFDVSIVTYGQKGAGKTYAVYGNGVDCAANETDYGMCQRFIRDLFQSLAKLPERKCRISISWNEIAEEDEQITDLLNNLGQVQCCSLKDCFDWIQIGYGGRNNENHNIFTLILEQQWVTDNGYNQHKLSTLSFCDLCGTERRFVANELNQNLSVPKNVSLQALEYSIMSSIDPCYNTSPPHLFHQSTLPTLLKDSFGGRAQTIFMLCVSPLQEDLPETMFNLEFVFKTQLVVNFVFMNAFTDNNVPVESLNPVKTDDFVNNNENQRFALQQWMKLIQNAEKLFNKCILAQSMDGLKQDDIEQIEKWLYLKAECDEFINIKEFGVEAPQLDRTLDPIEEMDEEEEHTQDTLSDSDSEICHKINDIDDVVDKLMLKFETKTDDIVEKSFRDYINSHPQALDSVGSLKLDMGYTRERRKSIQPGAAISSSDLAMLQSLNKSTELTKKSVLETNLQKSGMNISELEEEISDLEKTIKHTEKIIRDHEGTRSSFRSKSNKQAWEKELNKVTDKLSRAIANKKSRTDIEKLKHEAAELTSRINQSDSSESNIKRMKQDLYKYKKKIEGLRKSLKKERKVKESLQKQVESERRSKPLNEGKNKIRDIDTRIQNLNILLKEKDESLKNGNDSDVALSLRHEIRNLRFTKNHLTEKLSKLKKEKLGVDEYKLCEYEEAIEAIDTAIELKNEQICGRKSVDTDESLQREKGEQLMVARLNHLSTEELRTMLYKYYVKAIDLKKSSKLLDRQLRELDQEKEDWKYREKYLQNVIQQTRIEGENNLEHLKRNYAYFIQNLPMNDNPIPELFAPRYWDAIGTRALNPTVYGPLEKVKEKERESKKFFPSIFGGSEKKKNTAIPQENLKLLGSTSATLPAKVTRKRDKLIIQQQDSHR